MRHLKIVRITVRALKHFIQDSRPRVFSVKEGIPADAEFVRLGYDAERDMILAIYEHPSFPECIEGRIPQECFPIITEHYGWLPTDPPESVKVVLADIHL